MLTTPELSQQAGMAFPDISVPDLYRPYPPENAQVGCVDGRIIQFFIRIAGGIYGVAHNGAAAMEAESPGSFTGMGMSVPIFSLIANKILDGAGTMHPLCAGFEAGIDEGLIQKILMDPEREDEIFHLAALTGYDPFFTQEVPTIFKKALEAHRALYMSGLIPGKKEAEDAIFADEANAPEVVGLGQPDHDETAWVNTWAAGVALDTQEARALGCPTFEASPGSYGPVVQKLGERFGTLKVDWFQAATAIWHAAVIRALEQQSGQHLLVRRIRDTSISSAVFEEPSVRASIELIEAH